MLAPTLRHSRGMIALVVVLGVVSALAETAGVGMVLLLLSTLFDASLVNGMQGGIIPHSVVRLVTSVHGRVGVAASLLLGFILLRLALTTLHGIMTTRLAASVGHSMRVEVFGDIVDMPLEDMHRRSWGELYSLIEEYSYAIPAGLEVVCDLLRALTVAVVLSLLLLVAAPVLSVIAVAAFALFSQVAYFFQAPVIAAGLASSEAYRAMSEKIIRTLQALRTYRSLGLSRFQAENYAEASAKSAAAQLRAGILGSIIDPASHIAVLLALTLMAFVAEWLHLPNSQVVIAVGLLYRLQPYVASFEDQRLRLADLVVPLSRGAELPKRPPAATFPLKTMDFANKPIAFENVMFRYATRDDAVFEDFSFTIPPGGWTLIDGPSGAGKSTLVNLLLGLVQPGRGRITVGGVDFRELDIDSWRRNLSICGQDIELMSGTLRENLCVGAGSVSEDRLAEAMAIADLSAVVEALPDGLDTQLGEQGAQLSGGQRQRLSIARAVLRQPQVLILDEATSMVDRASQSRILQSLARLMEGRTVIVIGHHLTDLPELISRKNLGQDGAPVAVG
jgi:ABC-type multidrug transport system fused ATPase/permease subunit